MIGGKLVEYIIEEGGKLGIKKKNEDTIGRILKGLANIFSLGIAPSNDTIFSTFFKY